MSKFRAPTQTQLREKRNLGPAVTALIADGKLPKTLKAYTYGKCRCVIIFPYDNIAFNGTIYRYDRFPTEREIMNIITGLAPEFQKSIFATKMNNGQRMKDGRYVTQIFTNRSIEKPESILSEVQVPDGEG